MIRALALGAVLSASVLSVPVASSAPPVHFDLARSAPAADSTVHHVTEIRLWFTAVPQPNATSIRVVRAGGEAVPAGDVVQDPEDGRVAYVTLEEPLGPGAYTVAWRSMAADGHVVRGEFPFSVMAH